MLATSLTDYSSKTSTSAISPRKMRFDRLFPGQEAVDRVVQDQMGRAPRPVSTGVPGDIPVRTFNFG